MKRMILPFLFFCLAGCKNDDAKKSNTEYFPVLSYIQSQVAHVDTSVYSIMQVRKAGNRSDTSFIRREDFREAAADFLSIPDITSGKLSSKYEETRLYDEQLEKVIISYQAKDEDVEIQREDIIIIPTLGTENEVESIYIERFLEGKNNSIQKKMLWEVNRRFQVTSIFQSNNQEKIETVEVKWTDTR